MNNFLNIFQYENLSNFHFFELILCYIKQNLNFKIYLVNIIYDD